MLTYRGYVYTLVMAASADATALALSLAHCVSHWHQPDYRERASEDLSSLQRDASRLRNSVDKLLTALPPDAREAVHEGRSGLLRHLSFIEYWLGKNSPIGCTQDPIDIARRDLPAVLALFDEWYERHSSGSTELPDRLAPFITTGQLNAAVREAWAIFKSRLVDLFEVSDELDGHRLVDQLFGANGATAGIMSDSDRQGYANLFKGLYTLNRNPISHNDMSVNPEEIDAVLALVNTALARIEGLAAQRSDGAQPNVSKR